MVLAVQVSFAVAVVVNTMFVPVVVDEDGVDTDTSEIVHAESAAANGDNAVAKKAMANAAKEKKRDFFGFSSIFLHNLNLTHQKIE